MFLPHRERCYLFMKIDMRFGSFAILTFMGLSLSALTASANPAETVIFSSERLVEPDDGTYKKVPVQSTDECAALCKADLKCRGAVTYKPDVTKPEAICRLNNGFGANPVFPQTPPEPLDHEAAVRDLNAYRASHGLSPVRLDIKLNTASEIHAADLAQAGIISHEGTDGSTHGDRVHRVGYNFVIAGENVATGQRSWEDVFQAWKDSPGHNANLLREDVSDFGIALVFEPKTTYSTYWAMLVATPMEDE